MERENQVYRGPVKAVILDWAGTAVDYGCFGPVAVFQAAFAEFGIEPSIAEVRGPMGLGKRDHVAAMLAMPGIIAQWQAKWQVRPVASDIDAVYAKVLELMPVVLADYAEPVPGCREALLELREAGIRIGSCTGYSRSMMVNLLPRATAAGFVPDCLVCSDEVPGGRPLPWMCWRNMEQLGVYPPLAVVKAGDTVADIEEGLNAGCWSVGIIASSNGVGLTLADRAAMPGEEQARLEAIQKERLLAAGAHFVIESIADLPLLCQKISADLVSGQVCRGM